MLAKENASGNVNSETVPLVARQKATGGQNNNENESKELNMARKNCYHSTLASFGNPVKVTIQSDIQKTKKQWEKQGMPNTYVNMLINGTEYSYTCETVQCQEALRGLNGQTISLSAEGSKSDAIITVVGGHGGAAPQRQTQQQQGNQNQEQRSADTSHKQQTPLQRAEYHVGRNQSLYHIATRAAMKSTEQLRGIFGNGSGYSERFYEEYFLECLRGYVFGSSSAGVTLKIPLGVELKAPEQNSDSGKSSKMHLHR